MTAYLALQCPQILTHPLYGLYEQRLAAHRGRLCLYIQALSSPVKGRITCASVVGENARLTEKSSPETGHHKGGAHD